jgi:hypothetical protein
MGSHNVCTHWMYQYCVLYLAWWWLNEPKHVAEFLILITNICSVYWLNKLLYQGSKNVHLHRRVFRDARYGDALAFLRESRSNIPQYAQSLLYLVIASLPAATPQRAWSVWWMGYGNTINEPTGSDNRQLPDKITVLYIVARSVLTYTTDRKHTQPFRAVVSQWSLVVFSRCVHSSQCIINVKQRFSEHARRRPKSTLCSSDRASW